MSVLRFPVSTLINYLCKGSTSTLIGPLRYFQFENLNRPIRMVGYTTLVKGSLWVCWPRNYIIHYDFVQYTTVYEYMSILDFHRDWSYFTQKSHIWSNISGWHCHARPEALTWSLWKYVKWPRLWNLCEGEGGHQNAYAITKLML